MNVKIIMLTIIVFCAILTFVGCENGKNINIHEENILSEYESIEDLGPSKVVEEPIEIYEYNENGKIIIIMYHKFAENEGNDEWTRSYDNFYNDLKYLYDNNYRTISLNDYINNNIRVPVGCTPVVLTFDDGGKSQFNLIQSEDGSLIANPKSAVGIMEKFYKEYPEFGLNGTFYINGTSYFQGEGTRKERLQYLIDKGFEIGNHTNTHINLSKVTSEIQIQEEIGKVSSEVYELTGYKITSIALPFGISSKDYKEYIKKGEYNGEAYENKAVLLVGASPTYTSNNEKVDMFRLPRVRARGGNKEIQCDLYWWLEKLENNKGQKYYRIK